MENKRYKDLSALFGFLFVTLVGTLLHFAFKASNGNTLVGAFTPVNESVWEHLKLLLFPAILYAIIEYIIWGKDDLAYIPSKIYAILLGILFIIIGYYTYSGILGNRFLAADIGLLIAASGLTSLFTLLFSKKFPSLKTEKQCITALISLTILVLFFIYFTFHPPMLELFRDPISEDFGIIGTAT